MSAYSQQSAKRQKVRDTKGDPEYFQGIDKLEFNNMASGIEASYRHYNATERVHNKTMEEWTKFSLSLTHFRNNGVASFSQYCAPWEEGAPSLESHKRCLKALLELCAKLGVKYWTAFDTDLIPWSESWDEMRAHWDEMVEYIVEMGQRYHVTVLWIAPDLHSHPRYAQGAFTSSEVSTFTLAATQIKKCLEVSQRLSAECFLLWPCREGYGSVFDTDVHKEIKLFGKLLKLTAEYKERLNYRCQLLIMPYSPPPALLGTEVSRVHRYLWDCTSCLHAVRGAERAYRVCAPPLHHVYMASVYNMLGGITITDEIDPFDNKRMTLMMKCIIEQGAALPGGISLQLQSRWLEPRARCARYMQYMEAVARGLRHAHSLHTDLLLSKHLQQKYSSYNSGFGSRVLSGDVTMEECEDYYKKNHSTTTDAASKHRHMELAFQRYLDTSEHI